jgi:hypothetical protein
MDVLQLCWELTPTCDVDEARGRFRGIILILLSMLRSKLNQGMQMHLEGLALRWNFNQFYDDTGNKLIL